MAYGLIGRQRFISFCFAAESYGATLGGSRWKYLVCIGGYLSNASCGVASCSHAFGRKPLQ